MKKKFVSRGTRLEGIVISTKAPKTAIVERKMMRFFPKYERYSYVRKRIAAHIPENIKVKEGDRVVLEETRRISKIKSFIITKVVGEEK